MNTPEKSSPDAPVESGFWHELMDEIAFLEERTARWMLQAADPTRMDMQRLESCFRMTDTIRQAQEIADHEFLMCLGCGYEYFARGAITVQPCSTCGGCFFAVSQPH